MSAKVLTDDWPINSHECRAENKPADRQIGRDAKQPDSGLDSFVPKFDEGAGGLCLRTPGSPQNPNAK